MSTSTSIEWATKTWGPVLGCKKVSSGCDNCYAIRTAHRLASNPNPKVGVPYTGLTERTEHGLEWTGIVRTLPERLGDPLKWRKPERIFVNSQSDLFHPAVGEEFTARVFATMAASPRHVYQVLTKRPVIAARLLRNPAFWVRVERYAWELGQPGVPFRLQTPLLNVWIGTSVEDQATADERIPKLLQIPASVRWISAEPLLGPITFTHLHTHCPVHDFAGGFCSGPCPHRYFLDWVVIGGESGPDARPMHPDWARSIRDQCTAAGGVPILLKQRGAWTWDPEGGIRPGDICMSPDGFTDTAGTDYVCYANESDGTHLRRVGKKAAGRELDGVMHDAYPRAVAS